MEPQAKGTATHKKHMHQRRMICRIAFGTPQLRGTLVGMFRNGVANGEKPFVRNDDGDELVILHWNDASARVSSRNCGGTRIKNCRVLG